MPRTSPALWHRLLEPFTASRPYLPWLIWASVTWSVSLAALYVTNSFGYVPTSRLGIALLPAPLIFLALTWGTGQWLAPQLGSVPRRVRWYWLVISLAGAGLIFWHYPPPPLALPGEHALQIRVTGDRNVESTGSRLEILRLRYLDGRRVPPQAVSLIGEWEVDEQGGYIASGNSAVLALRGEMAGGAAVLLRYNQVGGIAQVTWDGVQQEIDTFSWYSTTSYTLLETTRLSLVSQAAALSWKAIYFSALFFLVWLLVLTLHKFAPQPKAERVVLALAALSVIVIAVGVKLHYQHFNDVRSLRDTYSYVSTASEPLFSTDFWLGERAFTIPLFLKILGVNVFNYHQPDVMWRFAEFQLWFSLLAWTVLAGVVASKFRHPWVRVLGFALVLFFSLNLEISMWDLFLLSESISFSLFALLAALWLVVFDRWFPPSGGGAAAPGVGWKEAAWLMGMLVVTVLFSFTRDTNLYLISLASWVIFGLGGALRLGGAWNRLRAWHPLALAYLGLVLVLFVAQPLIVDRSGRWQVHIYDHLGRRLLADPRAVAYLEGRGLPVTPQLLQVVQLTGPEYRAYLKYHPEMEAVREWVVSEGRSAYIGYLLAYPLDTLLAPISQSRALLNGSSVEYRYPKYSVLPVPPRIQDLTDKYYPHEVWGVLLLVGLTALSFFWAVRQGRPIPALVWLMLGFWISVYPLMGIVWHGNPLEPERHAGQIGIMIRLAGWLAVPLLLDALLAAPAWRRFWQIDSAA